MRISKRFRANGEDQAFKRFIKSRRLPQIVQLIIIIFCLGNFRSEIAFSPTTVRVTATWLEEVYSAYLGV